MGSWNSPKPIWIESHDDRRGSLISIEKGNVIPFDPKRMFYIFGVPRGATRGGHAHLNCQQFLVAVSGQCMIRVVGIDLETTLKLGGPSLGMYVPPLYTVTLFDFTRDCVVLVLCSDYYDPGDYVEDGV